MSEEGTGRSVGPLLELRGFAVPTVVVLCLTFIWAVTGAGYFWPVWLWFLLAVAIGLLVAVRWARRQPPDARRLAGQASVSGVLALALVAIWAMSRSTSFWPVWPILVLATAVALHWASRLPGQRSLEGRVDELTRTRSGALDVQAVELRRIERDLHDGAQARLVALSMQLGRAEERLSDQPETAALVRRAREEATAAIGELRDLARGIAPPVLADRGLAAAVRSLADRSATMVQVKTETQTDRRPPPAVETAAYFVVAESLTNTAKHAPRATAQVTLSQTGGELVVQIGDDGPGGADPVGGGLTGLRQRVEALDGRLEIESPPGGGTTIRAVMPCE